MWGGAGVSPSMAWQSQYMRFCNCLSLLTATNPASPVLPLQPPNQIIAHCLPAYLHKPVRMAEVERPHVAH